ncbi:MAG: hypothetical protein AB7S26_18545 [Sandaracinaceae bacterium]
MTSQRARVRWCAHETARAWSNLVVGTLLSVFVVLLGGCRGLGADVIELAPCDGGTTTAFADDFEDGVVDPAWTVFGASEGGSVEETGGSIRLTPSPARGSRASIVTNIPVHLTDGVRIEVSVEEVLASTNLAWTHLQLITDPSDIVRLYVQEGQICASFQPGGGAATELGCRAHAGAADRVWRIERRGDRIEWGAGPDAAATDVLADSVVPFDVSDVYLQVEAGTSQAVPGVGQVRVTEVDVRDPSGSPCSP